MRTYSPLLSSGLGCLDGGCKLPQWNLPSSSVCLFTFRVGSFHWSLWCLQKSHIRRLLSNCGWTASFPWSCLVHWFYVYCWYSLVPSGGPEYRGCFWWAGRAKICYQTLLLLLFPSHWDSFWRLCYYQTGLSQRGRIYFPPEGYPKG